MTKVVNTSPNGEEVRDMTADELAQLEKDKVSGAEFDANIQAKADAKASGNQKLLDLGLTQAEATALTGYTPPLSEE